MQHLFDRIKRIAAACIPGYGCIKLFVALLFMLVYTQKSQTAPSPVSDSILKKTDALVQQAKESIYSNPDKAKEYANEALILFEKAGNKNGMALSCNIIGSVYFINGDYHQANHFYSKSLHINKQIRNQEGLAKNFNNIGNCYLKLNELELALENYFAALQIYDNLKNTAGRITINNNIGLIYKNTGSVLKAINYYEQALTAARDIDDRQQQGAILYNMASVYIIQGDYEKARDVCESSLSIRRELNQKSGIIKNLTSLGRIHSYLKNTESATGYFEEALELARELNSKDQVAAILQHLGYNALANNDFTLAKKHLTQSLHIAEELRINRLLENNYNYLAYVDSMQGNYASAMNYQQKYFLLKAAKQQFSVDEKLAELEKKYALTLKENLENSNRLQKSRSLIAYLLTALIVVGLVSVVLIQQIRLKAQVNINKLTQQNLRSQMNPHFIFNVLNSIQYYILRNDTKASSMYLSKFAQLLRLTLDNAQSNLVSINDEVESLKLYLELEAMRLEDHLEYAIEVDEGIDRFMFKIPTLLIQPYVENSIIHGIQQKKGKGKVHIQMKMHGNMIHCLIEDNGVGREKADKLKTSEQKQRKSYGSSITETRLKLLNSLYGKDLGIAYSDLKDENMNPCGTRVEFDLPVMN